MKTKIIVLGIMLLSSSSIALADTQTVDAEHLRAHRIYEEENLERQRFKLESEIGKPARLLWRKNNKSYPPFNFDEFAGTYFFGQHQLNQSGMPLQPGNYGIFKCKPSLSKSWKDYKSNETKERINGDVGGYEAPPEIRLKTDSVFELGPYYRERPPRSNVSGRYQNQEWDIYPEFEKDKKNSPPYFDFDHSSTKPPPPPMIKTLSKENLPGDSP